jgi:hypothetical protein
MAPFDRYIGNDNSGAVTHESGCNRLCASVTEGALDRNQFRLRLVLGGMSGASTNFHRPVASSEPCLRRSVKDAHSYPILREGLR